MNVLVIPPSYYSENRVVGGGERFAFEYAKALAELCPVTMALYGPQAKVEEAGKLRIEHFRIPTMSTGKFFPFSASAWAAFRNYDLIHIFIFPTPLADTILFLSRFYRNKIILTDVGGSGPCLSTYVQKFLGADLNRRADGLALLSKYSASFFSDWQQPQTILYGGVPPELLEGSIGEPQGYVLYVGRILPHKGLLPVVEALAPGMKLKVVGRPYDQEYLAKVQAAAVGKDVDFYFDANDAALAEFYRGANVVLQPSLPVGFAANKAELLGLVTLEAMAMGKPVIVTRTTSLPELLEDGRHGFIVPPGDRVAMHEKMRFFLQNPDAAKQMGIAARAHVLQNFSWQQVAARGMKLYQEIL